MLSIRQNCSVLPRPASAPSLNSSFTTSSEWYCPAIGAVNKEHYIDFTVWQRETGGKSVIIIQDIEMKEKQPREGRTGKTS